MIEKEFNLLIEPWILVMCDDGTINEVSMLDLFRHAHKYQSFAGELPTQDIAVMRLLLAVLHATFGRYDHEGAYNPISKTSNANRKDVIKRWKSLWDGKEFPYTVIEKYLSEYEYRFWLFHPEFPFYQVAALEFMPATSYDSSKLIGELSESSNKVRLFPGRSGTGKQTLSFNEAARWLLYVNAFDDTSAKPKEKNLPSPGAGWLGKLGLVSALGDNLFETLMLNFVLLPNGEKNLWDDEKPIWEQKINKDERTEIVIPDNASELLTLQSRRLLLKRDGEFITGYNLLGGDFFSKENAFKEQMTVWRNAAKKGSVPQYVPKRHDPAKKLWRDFSTLLIQNDSKKRPGLLNWISSLTSEKAINNRQINFYICAAHYGDKDFFIDDVFYDSLSFNIDLLIDVGNDWVERILNEIETTEKLVLRLESFAINLTIAEGSSNGAERGNAAREQAYYQLDAPFRLWLEVIDPVEIEKNAICNAWFTDAQKIIWVIGDELIKRCGNNAYIGREVINNKTNMKRRYAAPELFNTFLRQTSSRDALKYSDRKEAGA